MFTPTIKQKEGEALIELNCSPGGSRGRCSGFSMQEVAVLVSTWTLLCCKNPRFLADQQPG